MTDALHGARAPRPLLSASWRDIVAVTWRVDPVLFRHLLADRTELDKWEGDALVSLVALHSRATRLLGVRVPFHVDFPDLSLRVCVRRKMPDGTWRRGVTILQGMVPRAAIAYGARSLHGLPYVAPPMRRAAVPEAPLDGRSPGATRSLVYEWRRAGEWERIIALVNSPAHPTRYDSVERFISERDWIYSCRPGKPTLEFQLEHSALNISLTAECIIEADIESLFGARFAEALNEPPISTFVADGSTVAVYPGTPIRR